MPRIVFIADETDADDLNAVFRQLERLDATGFRVHPEQLSFACEDGRIDCIVAGKRLEADLIVGWVFEDWLAPGVALLEMLELAGYKILNSGPVLFRGQNKALMTAHLHHADVRHEPVWFSHEPAASMIWSPGASFPLVVKPGLVICGGRTVPSSGSGVVRVDNSAALGSVHSLLAALGQPVYAQRYVSRPGNRDIRVWVFGFQTVCAVMKVPPPGQWITHVSTGSSQEPFTPDAELCMLAESAARAIGAEIAGVDLAETQQGYTVFEVNTCPTFLRASSVWGDLIPARLAELLVDRSTNEMCER